MEPVKIGTSKIIYNENGEVLSSVFLSELHLTSKDLLPKLKNIKAGKSAVKVKQQADVIIATWFSKMNEIELSDPAEYTVTSKIVECKNYPDGTIKKCVLEFYWGPNYNLEDSLPSTQ